VSTTTSVKPTPTPQLGSLKNNQTILSTSTSITYVPGTAWSASNVTSCRGGQTTFSNTTGSSISFTFTGIAVYIQTTTNPLGGLYDVTIDGNSVDTAKDDYSAAAAPCTIGFSQTGLSNTQHTLQIALLSAQSKGPTSAVGFWLDSIIFTSLITTNVSNPEPTYSAASPHSRIPFWYTGLLFAIITRLLLL